MGKSDNDSESDNLENVKELRRSKLPVFSKI